MAQSDPVGADAGATTVEVGGRRLRLTHLDKVLYPATGTTKAEVLDYYARVAPVLLPGLVGRPVTRKRWVDGVGTREHPGEVFFEKNLPESAPDWIPRRRRSTTRDGGPHATVYPLVDEVATLVWMAQQAALELHVPQWRFGPDGEPRNPDRLVLDLDPGEGAGLAECVRVAAAARVILEGMGLAPIPVTSGSAGLHLYCALDGRQSSDDVSAVARELARALEAAHPDLVVSSMTKAIRAGKVLVDWSQNNGMKTTIAPYSLRGRERPTVAAPRTWEELADPGLRHLELGEVLARVESGLDPVAPLAGSVTPADVEARLARYREMRDARRTPEPMGGATPGAGAAPIFVVQEHHARRTHFDVRLERDGVLVSWAVPRGIPESSGRNHLAIHTEDHPLEYADFEGEIPRGEYGAGSMTIWDRGTVDVEKWRDDEVIATLHGERRGSHRIALIRTEGGRDQHGTTRDGSGGGSEESGHSGETWLLHRMADQRPVDWDDPASVAASKRRTAATGSWERVGTPVRSPLTRTGRTVVGSRVRVGDAPGDVAAGGAVAPMLAAPVGAGEPTGPGWVFEGKWDGYRAIATIRDTDAGRPGALELRSRNGLDFGPSYPELSEIVAAIRLADGVPTLPVVLDGEIVALDDAGRPDFGRLQSRSGLTSPRDVARARSVQSVAFFAFDVLAVGGRALVEVPYEERRALLRALVTDTDAISVPDDLGTDRETAVAASAELGLEGVVAKRAGSPYRVGRRSRDWLKIKAVEAQEVVVVGWRPGEGARAASVGSLLLGVPEGGRLRYVGRVGSGFRDRDLARLRATLEARARDRAPVVDVPPADSRDAHWVEPDLVGEVTHAGWTSDGRLRAPVWRGWRPDLGHPDLGSSRSQ